MRFPIVIKARFSEHVEYANMSAGLQESLRDVGVLDPETNHQMQDHFDLEITEGSLLSCLGEFFNLTSRFHIGCSTDERPPSFSFSTSCGSYETVEGGFSFGYDREMKLDTFVRNRHFRNGRGHRDLNATAAAFNDRSNYKETICVGWHGWSGEYTGQMKTGFVSDFIYLEFDAPKPEKPKLVYHQKSDSPLRQFFEGSIPEGEDYPVSEAVFSILKIASRIFPTKLDVGSNRQKIEKVCEVY